MKFKVGDKAVFYRYSSDGWEKDYGVDVGDVVTIGSVEDDYCSFFSKTGRIVFTGERCLKPYNEESNNEDQDVVNHPKHYTSDPSGVECIQVTRHRNFNIGNALKYLWRAGLKDSNPQTQDLRKAIWYIEDEIKRLEQGSCTE